MRLIDNCQIVPVIPPLDLDTDRTGDWVSLANYKRVLFVFTKSPGTAGDDFNFTIQQASAADGTGAKDLDVVDEYWIKQAATDLTSTGQFTRTTQTADALVAGNATSAEQAVLLAVEVRADQLDTDNGFEFVNASVTLDASGGAQYGAVLAILYEPRYPQNIGVSALA